MPDRELDNNLADNVRQTLERLLTSRGEERRQAARELHRLGVQARGSIRPRGSLATPARNTLPQPEKLPDLIACLNDEDDGVRCQVAAALGEWGDEEAAAALDNRLRSDSSEEVQLFCVTALRMIGGANALDGLAWALDRGTPAVYNAALTAIEELTTGGRFDDSEPALVPEPTRETVAASPAVRTKGAVRTRGAVGRSSPALGRIQASLRQILARTDQSEYLRHRAEKVFDLLCSRLQ